MNLYFRVLKILFLHLFRILKCSRDPRDSFTLHFRAWLHDIDFNFHMNNGRYLTIMDLGRLDLMFRLGIISHVFKNLWMPVVGTAFVRFRQPIGALKKYELKTRIAAWDEKWFYIEHSFLSGGEVVAIGYVKGLIRDKQGAVPVEKIFLLAGISPDAAKSPPVPEVFHTMETANASSRAALARHE